MTNKHSRLKALEKLAAFQKVKAKSQSLKIESDRLQASVAELTNEELKSRYETTMEDIRNAPPNLELEGLTTSQIIEKCQQLCKENKND